MIDVNGKPLIYHVMKTYAKSGFKEFIIASGYKGHIIKKYFQKKFMIGIFQLLTLEKYHDRRKSKEIKKNI